VEGHEAGDAGGRGDLAAGARGQMAGAGGLSGIGWKGGITNPAFFTPILALSAFYPKGSKKKWLLAAMLPEVPR